MHGFSTALENGIFKAFNIWGRSSRSEFWLIMPLIWGLLIVLLVLDLQTIWADLRIEKIPSLNPFNYSFLLFFIVTWPSRISLTVRRLHDSGRSGKWAIAPYKATILGFWLIVGLVMAMMTSNPDAGLALGAATFGMGALAVMTDSFWPLMFEIAQRVDLWTLFDAFRQLIGTALGQVDPQALNPVGLASNFSQDYGGDATTGILLTFVVSTMIFGPFILTGLWFLFLIMPANRISNRFGEPSLPARRIKASGKGKSNAFSGYSALAGGVEKTAMDPAQRKAEVAAFYQQRVAAQGRS